MTDVRTIVDGIGGVLVIGTTVVLSPLLAPWYRTWGATHEETQCSLPGDGLVPHPRSRITCAITVQAPVEQVWPWLVQLGCQRAGWYSYDLLDNGGLASADLILAEHQMLSVGDEILLTPDGRLSMPVVALEPQRGLVLGGTLDTRTGQGIGPADPLPASYYSGINSFVLERSGEVTTRLLFRQLLAWSPGWANTLMYRVFLEPISFVMGRRMLRGIKQRAESR